MGSSFRFTRYHKCLIIENASLDRIDDFVNTWIDAFHEKECLLSCANKNKRLHSCPTAILLTFTTVTCNTPNALRSVFQSPTSFVGEFIEYCGISTFQLFPSLESSTRAEQFRPIRSAKTSSWSPPLMKWKTTRGSKPAHEMLCSLRPKSEQSNQEPLWPLSRMNLERELIFLLPKTRSNAHSTGSGPACCRHIHPPHCQEYASYQKLPFLHLLPLLYGRT